jgi:hypothetical protein
MTIFVRVFIHVHSAYTHYIHSIYQGGEVVSVVACNIVGPRTTT